jgi:hypothetical protein
VKPTEVSGTKKNDYLKTKIDEHENKREIKNIKDFYREISDFKMGYHLELT